MGMGLSPRREVDVAHQVGLQIDVLDQRQRIVGIGTLGMVVEHLDGAVATESRRSNSAREQQRTHVVANDRHAVEVGFDRGARQRLERRLPRTKRGAQSAFG